MDIIEPILNILYETTVPLATLPNGVYSVYRSEIQYPEEFEFVDCHLITVAVHKGAAKMLGPEIQILLSEWKELHNGMSYIEAGYRLGSSQAALQLFALGEVLGLWKVLTPADILGTIEEPELADRMAAAGYIINRAFVV